MVCILYSIVCFVYLSRLKDNEQMVDMRYASIFPTDAKRVAYVNFYKHIGLLYCHVIACKDKARAAAVVTAINAAVTKATEPVPEFFGTVRCMLRSNVRILACISCVHMCPRVRTCRLRLQHVWCTIYLHCHLLSCG